MGEEIRKWGTNIREKRPIKGVRKTRNGGKCKKLFNE